MLRFWKKSTTRPSRVVIVGAGFGGLSAARELEKLGGFEVTVLDRTNHHLFQPLLYQVATGGLNPSEISSPIRSLFRESPCVTVLLGALTGVDRVRRVIQVDQSGLELAYDYLILALGGQTSYFGHPEWEKWAPGLKTLEDARKIRQKVLLAFERAELESDPEARRRLMTVAVIGGGPTGVEMAGALAELRTHVLRREFKRIKPEEARVLLLEAGSRVLSTFPEKASDTAADELRRLGVEVLLGETVEEISCGSVRTQRRTLAAENVIWAAGVAGHPLAGLLGAPLDRAGRVKVNPELNLADDERVFCLGDMAHVADKSGRPLPGVAPVAVQQGKLAARNIAKLQANRKPKPFSYFDKGSMATIGRKSAVAVLPGGILLSGWAAWLGWLAVHLAFLVDLQNRILVILRWGWAYLGWKWNVRLIAEPSEAAGTAGLPHSTRTAPAGS
ncbi:NAD(P)/FAD-dependent oxidoreductase [bacterium]|nr:NAD(P)/FAD-dependent oxidoreductase [bacterium]